MKNLIILVLTLIAAFALPSEGVKSRNLVVPAGTPEGRISRGHDAAEGQFPYQVGLSLKGKDSGIYFCGASLISNEWVLTAAHCTERASQATVFLGSTQRRAGEVKHVVDAKDFIIHKDHNRLSLTNDISLIKIPYTKYSANIKHVKLPAINGTHSDYTGEIAVASGWGRTTDAASSSADKLQWAGLTVITNDVCKKSFNFVRIVPLHLCTSSTDSVNTCKGDSGGPLVLKSSNTQIGVVSFGDENCLKDVPGVCVRLTSYLEWIKQHTGISY